MSTEQPDLIYGYISNTSDTNKTYKDKSDLAAMLAKIDASNNRYNQAVKEAEDQYKLDTALNIGGGALMIGSSLIPMGGIGAATGERLLAPIVGRAIGSAIGRGAASGGISGLVYGLGDGLHQALPADEIAKKMAYDGTIGFGTGGVLGGIGGKAEQLLNRDALNTASKLKQLGLEEMPDGTKISDMLQAYRNSMAKFASSGENSSGLLYDKPMEIEPFKVNWDNKQKSNWKGTNEKGNYVKSKSRYYPQKYRMEEFDIRVSDHNKALKGSGQWSDDSYTIVDFNGTPVKFDNDFINGDDLSVDIVVNKIGDFTKNKKAITDFINNKITETYNKWNKENPKLWH